MAENPFERRTELLLFLGAGFSRDAGLPLMAEFGDLSFANQPGLTTHACAPPDSPDFRHAAPMLTQAGRTYHAFQALCARTGLLSHGSWNNLEDVFCVAEALHESGTHEVMLDRQPYNTDTLLRNIQLWIWKAYQQLPVKRGEVKKGAVVNRQPYERLFDLLRDLNLSARTTILTTNYDIVVEYFCYLHGIRSWYPVEWDSSFRAGHGYDLYIEPRASFVGPLVCKLHGSVNFFENSEEANNALYVAGDLGDGKDIGRSGGEAFRDEPAILAVDAIWNIQTRYGVGYTPAIIPPGYAKLQRRRWLTLTWAAALSAIAQARELVFIGYSLPSSDGFMRALFTAAEAIRDSGHLPNVTVVDTAAYVRRRYSELYPQVGPAAEMGFAASMETVVPEILARVAS